MKTYTQTQHEELAFGDRVTVCNRLVRKDTPNHEKYYRWDKTWQEEESEPETGIFLGWRTLSNGIRYNDFTYRATEYFRAALVCTSEHKNPFYATDVQKVEQGPDVFREIERQIRYLESKGGRIKKVRVLNLIETKRKEVEGV